ncbi:MAG TPA: winged helix-turn-helix transcriptional regulator, partial [Burkholderiales bacterium]
RPPRYEYVLTERGRDFQPVIVAMQTWGNKHFAPEGASVLLVHAKTGATAEPVMVDRKTGRPLTQPEYVVAPGPAAGEGTRRKLASSAWGHAANPPPSPFDRRSIRKRRANS